MDRKVVAEIYEDIGQLFAALKVNMIEHHKACDPDGLTSLGFGALGILSRMGPLPVSELARLLRISKSQATAVVDCLVGGGMVERAQSDEDRRVVELSITPEGRKALARRLEETYSHVGEKLGRLDAKEIAAIRSSLRTLTELLGKIQE
jgi:DNA-binding MarR family transcriptional regulator